MPDLTPDEVLRHYIGRPEHTIYGVDAQSVAKQLLAAREALWSMWSVMGEYGSPTNNGIQRWRSGASDADCDLIHDYVRWRAGRVNERAEKIMAGVIPDYMDRWGPGGSEYDDDTP